MSEKQNKNVTVRVQKIKKNHIKQKLAFFLILAIGLVVLAVFSEHLCPYDPYAQDLASALQPPSLQHPMGTDTYGRDMLSRVISGKYDVFLASDNFMDITTLEQMDYIIMDSEEMR